ncbi:MAG: helix-turn-helix domain-containing protein [Lachnospiraceae bacterium]
MELDYVNLGERIAKRRKQVNIKQNVLAEQLNISNNYLSSIERGKEKPSLEILIKICNALNITPDYLIMGSMHSNNVPMRIIEGLRLCSDSDISLLQIIVEAMVERNGEKWNDDNFA